MRITSNWPKKEYLTVSQSNVVANPMLLQEDAQESSWLSDYPYFNVPYWKLNSQNARQLDNSSVNVAKMGVVMSNLHKLKNTVIFI